MPMPKEQIEILCKDENFIQDFLRYETVREQTKRLGTAISTIEELTPDGMPEYQSDLDPVRANWKRIQRIATAHANLLEDVYGVTWHCYDTIIEFLSNEGRL